MCNACEPMIEHARKGRHHRNAIKLIKALESNACPNILEQVNLCNWYWTVTNIPFSDEPNPIREYCKVCQLHITPDEQFNAIHSGEFGEIIWGRVRK